WGGVLRGRVAGGDTVVMGALRRGIPLESDGWGERTSLRGLARKLIDQRDLAPVAALSTFDPDAVHRELLEKGARAAQLAAMAREGDLLAGPLPPPAAFAAAP